MLEEFSQPLYVSTPGETHKSSDDGDNDVHMDTDTEPHVIGIIPHFQQERLELPTIEALESFKVHSNITVGNIIWTILIGWWVALLFAVTGLICFLTIAGYRQGIFFMKLARFVLFPFGIYAYRETEEPDNLFLKILTIVLSPLFLITSFIGMFISWETVYFIPMAKFLKSVVVMCFKNPAGISFENTINNNTQGGRFPLLMIQTSGSSIYFKFTILGFEVVYLNFLPCVVIALLCGFWNPQGTFLSNDLFGAAVAMLGAIPCAYAIGVCVDDISHQLGLIPGTIINSSFISIVELILYYFSLSKGLNDYVRAAICGAFYMNLLIIPGLSMLAAGLKWKEVVMNKRAQAISGTFLLLAICSVLFPSMFYHIHSMRNEQCELCYAAADLLNGSAFNCSRCIPEELPLVTDDPIYSKYAEKLMICMAVCMPIIYIIGVYFSIKTHSHIYEYKRAGDENHEESAAMKKTVAITLLLVSTVMFSLMAHVMTEKIPNAIEKLGFSQRFIGLIFFTIIPNVAEYMNAIKFALSGNIGLSMEIGNQGSILTAMIELPATVLLSYIIRRLQKQPLFTLIFPWIDVICLIISVFMRNSILAEESISYFTGIAFLFVFLFIAIVYFFDYF